MALVWRVCTGSGALWVQTFCAVLVKGCSTLPIEVEVTVRGGIGESGSLCWPLIARALAMVCHCFPKHHWLVFFASGIRKFEKCCIKSVCQCQDGCGNHLTALPLSSSDFWARAVCSVWAAAQRKWFSKKGFEQKRIVGVAKAHLRMHNSFSCNPVSKYNSSLSFCSVSYCCRVFLIASVILSFSLISAWGCQGCWQNLCLLKTRGRGMQGHSGSGWISFPCSSLRLNMTLGHIIYSTAAPGWE